MTQYNALVTQVQCLQVISSVAFFWIWLLLFIQIEQGLLSLGSDKKRQFDFLKKSISFKEFLTLLVQLFFGPQNGQFYA